MKKWVIVLQVALFTTFCFYRELLFLLAVIALELPLFRVTRDERQRGPYTLLINAGTVLLIVFLIFNKWNQVDPETLAMILVAMMLLYEIVDLLLARDVQKR